MAIVTEPTSSTPGKKKKNSPPAPSSSSGSPDSSALLETIESLKKRIEELENRKELDADDREALSEFKAALKAKKEKASVSETPAPLPSGSDAEDLGAGFF